MHCAVKLHEAEAELHCAVTLHVEERKGALCCHVTWSRKQSCTVLSHYMSKKAKVHCDVKSSEQEVTLHCCQVDFMTM